MNEIFRSVQNYLLSAKDGMSDGMNLLTQLSRIFFIFLILIFTLQDYTYYSKKTPEGRERVAERQAVIMYLFSGLGFLLIFLNTGNLLALVFLAGVYIYYSAARNGYMAMYSKASMLLVNNMLMLLSIGFIIIARLSLEQAVKQFIIASAGTVLSFLIPVVVRKMKILPRLTWLYAALGIIALLGVLALATVSGGAKLSISVAGITIQFSELVKITLVFFIASMLARDTSFRSSTDLGTAVVFFAAYIVMVFVATRKAVYPLAGLLGGSAAAVAAYFLFGHVRQRVIAWKDPLVVYDTSGYIRSSSMTRQDIRSPRHCSRSERADGSERVSSTEGLRRSPSRPKILYLLQSVRNSAVCSQSA